LTKLLLTFAIFKRQLTKTLVRFSERMPLQKSLYLRYGTIFSICFEFFDNCCFVCFFAQLQAATDKNDPVMVDTYRRLKTLRSNFEQLIDTVGKIGQQEKAHRDLETKIDQEQTRISSNNVDRIKEDLDAICKENAQLVAQIKALSTKGK
jgi:hypothetical protein